MDYVIVEILFCLLAVGAIAVVVGWLLHGVLGQGKLKALEASKNRQIEDLKGELDTVGKARVEISGALDKATSQTKDAEAKLAAAAKLLSDSKSKQEAATAGLKARIAELEPQIAERDERITAWQK